MPYPIEIIGTDEKQRFYTSLMKRPLVSRKANVYGCCIKLMTDSKPFAEIWSDNFYSADENNRSHGRIMAVEDPSKPLHMKYDPLTKTAFVYNFDYYGWLKSVALAITGDMLEDAHQIHSVHGAALDIMGKGAALIAPSGTGKTTHSWGMLRNPGVRLVADDWFFVRLYERSAICYGSEKNCYVDADLGRIWPEYREVLERVVSDKQGRAVVNVRWVVGADGVVPMTTLKKVVLLKRDPADPSLLRQISDREALGMLMEKEFYNPHQLVRDERKLALRKGFFSDLLSKVECYVANTTESPATVQEKIFKALTGD
jgi:hypothetical protein